MRIIAITQKIILLNNYTNNKLIHDYFKSYEEIKNIEVKDLVKRSEVKYGKTNYLGDHLAYAYRFTEYTDRILLRPNFENKSFIWIFLSDNNLKKRILIEKKIFAISTPISMEYGQQLNDRMVQTPNYVYLDKEYGEFGTEKWLGFNIEWTFIVDFKVDIKSKIPKEVLLKAPAYKVEELDNGCVYVQLTEEEPLATEFDEEYVSGYIEFRKYCEDWIKENTK
jgi:hypothetical protein